MKIILAAFLLAWSWHLIELTGLDGVSISLNASSIVDVRPSPPGYAKGTLIVTSSGQFIVRETEAEVKKAIECECAARHEAK